jgi:hypothetical protein
MAILSPLQMERELGELRQDWQSYRAQGWSNVLRERPAKGLRRSVLIAGWLALHALEAVAITVYGLPWGPSGAPVRTVLWLLVTSLAGLQYVRLVFSDPGFLTPASVQALADEQIGPGAVDVRGTAEIRGEIVLAVEDCRVRGTSAGPGAAMAPVEEENSESGEEVGVDSVSVRIPEGGGPRAAAGGHGANGGAEAARMEGAAEAGGRGRAGMAAAEGEDEEEEGDRKGEEDEKGEGEGDVEAGQMPSAVGANGPADDSGLGMGLARVLEDETARVTARVRLDTDGEPMSKERSFWEEREELTKDNSEQTGLPEQAARWSVGCLFQGRGKGEGQGWAHASIDGKWDWLVGGWGGVSTAM